MSWNDCNKCFEVRIFHVECLLVKTEVESILWLLYEDIGKMVPFIDHTALFAVV